MEKKKIKVAYIVERLAEPGGIERIITLKANYLADELGYDVTVITLFQGGRPIYYPLSKNINLINADFALKAESSLWGKLRQFKYNAQAIPEVWRKYWYRGGTI